MEQFIETRQLNSLNSFKCFERAQRAKTYCAQVLLLWGKKRPDTSHTPTYGLQFTKIWTMKNIMDSPMCQYGSNGNTQHFFFHCNFYQRQRTIPLNSVAIYQTPTLDLLLNGDPSLSKAINEDIFKHEHEYILDSKRF